MTFMDGLIIFGSGIAAAIVLYVGFRVLRARSTGLRPEKTQIEVIAEHVRAVGRLVGLEVSAKEIATAKKGFAWLPPLLLSQAKLAMIFHFEKQYGVDLARLGQSDVEDLGEGRFRLALPEIEGTLRLTDVSPYDIQDGRVLGLLDVIQMNAENQGQLMQRAQEQAAELFQRNDARYLNEARASIEKQITSLLGFFGVSVEILWPDQERTEPRTMIVDDEDMAALPAARRN
ncbi:MAG: DUF4230 domain-containing protein [Phycisphaerales bacterium JB037]